MLSVIFFFSGLLGPQGYAAVAPAAAPNSAMEILSLPENSRIAVAKTQPVSLYRDLILLSFSDQRSMQTRWRALILASQLNPKKAHEELTRAIGQKEWFMKNAALIATKMVWPEKSQEFALKLINDKALVVRTAAVQALSDQPEPLVRDTLWSEMRANYNFHKGQSLWVRADILRKLAIHPEKAEFNSFVAALKEKDQELHVPAIEALEKISNKKLGRDKATVREKKNLWLDYASKRL